MRARTFGLAACVAMGSACGGAVAVRPAMPTVEDAMKVGGDGRAICEKSPTRDHPLVVEWPATDRATLDAKLGDGIVAVRFEGCNLQVLRSCQVPGYEYAYRGVSKSTDGFHVASADELYARLPVGAANLAGELQTSRAIDVSYTQVGVMSVEPTRVARGDLQGECSGATHFIRAVTVGAFDLTTGASAGASGGVGVAGAGAGGASQSSARVLRSGGSLSACKGSAKTREPGCDVSVQLELIAVDPSPTPVLAVRDKPAEDGQQGAPSSLADARTAIAPAQFPSLVATDNGWMMIAYDELRNGTREVRSFLLGPQGALQRDAGAAIARAAGFVRMGNAVRVGDKVLAAWSAEAEARRFSYFVRWIALDGTPTSPPIEIKTHDQFSQLTVHAAGPSPVVVVRDQVKDDKIRTSLVEQVVFQRVDATSAAPSAPANLGLMDIQAILPTDADGRHGVLLGEGPCAGEHDAHLCRYATRWSDASVAAPKIVPGERTAVSPFRTGGDTEAITRKDGRVVDVHVDKQGCVVAACGNLVWAEYAPDLGSYRRTKALTRDDQASYVTALRTPAGIALAWINAAPAPMGASSVPSRVHFGVLDDDGNWVEGPFVTRREGFPMGGAPSVAYDGHVAAAAWTWCDAEDRCAAHFVRFDDTNELVKE